MPAFKPKTYQQDALDATATYFRACQQWGDADYVFQKTTQELRGEKQMFVPLKGFSEESGTPLPSRLARGWSGECDWAG